VQSDRHSFQPMTSYFNLIPSAFVPTPSCYCLTQIVIQITPFPVPIYSTLSLFFLFFNNIPDFNNHNDHTHSINSQWYPSLNEQSDGRTSLSSPWCFWLLSSLWPFPLRLLVTTTARVTHPHTLERESFLPFRYEHN
jgi:hypothetical protein